ncbi:polysaccharide biosynthesis tyrosine autokinase [Vibrio cyclitrophicus]|uniref:polysaccharide biosynthesis tyrosine autokinase n=1 Tax=Vibrio cyclitrophicus TaxID=47951 RepID=UPI000C82635C|nr:polysaccharide biosynthesis tyrosine autokinase [Vibrio cyclitrophicus]PME42040.1 tyrosine-protein kinase [Vibrio cyclitrophicus]PME46484.1 tyrosine-protein kinase [Vibrio cyclitrophicus]PMF41833.1 tyrosine-protein kinase [Vibrio cyclitrophicus]PMK23527.1 tyrosine-protein kinase [Vibrio cyclitrophicus]
MTTQPSQQSHIDNSDEIDLGKLLGILLDAKWIILCTTVIFMLGGVIYAVIATPIFKADALVQVEEKSAGVPGLSDISDMFASESSSDTEIQIIKSRMIVGNTVDKLQLTIQVKPKYFPIVGKGFARLAKEDTPNLQIDRLEVPKDLLDESMLVTIGEDNTYILSYGDEALLEGTIGQVVEQNGIIIGISSTDSKPGTQFTVTKAARLVTIAELQDSLGVAEQGKKTGILRLVLEGDQPEKIQQILNSIASDYLMQNVERTSAEAEKSLQFLRGHLPEIQQELDSSEGKLNKFKIENDSVDLALEAESVLKTMVTIESQLNELTFKEADIAQRFKKSHPAYIALNEKRETLEGEKRRLENMVAKMPQTQQEVIRLSRDVEVNQAIYLQLVEKVQELNVMKASAVGNVRVLDYAETLEEPVKPKKAIIVVIATLLGGMLSVAFVLVKAAFHRGVESPDQIEHIGLPVYAAVPKSDLQIELSNRFKSKKQKTKGAQALLAESNPADLSVEALRGLRTSLHFAMLEAKNNILMISGPAPGIGKSFISTNFAAVAAKTGQKVLLIDADMRKGYLQQSFGVNWDNGLSDVLSGKQEFAQSVKTTPVENLDIITRGQVPPNPSELLMHPRFAELMEWASKEYDLVIVDTPPVLAVTDPSIVGAFAGTTLMVARYGQNTIKEIDVARHRFEQSGIEVKGVIFNAIEKKASSSYGYGYYNYAYSSDKK